MPNRVLLLGKVIDSVRHVMTPADMERYEKAKSIPWIAPCRP